MKTFIILLIHLSLILNLNAQTKKRIAVLNLESVGVSKSESVTLTDRLRSELVKTGTFIIIERAEMDDILLEQGFQLTGCTTDECVVEAGMLLNVSHICAGSIGKVGALYTVSVRLIDVETGEILKTVTEDSRGSIENVLTASMRNVAIKLSGRMASGGALPYEVNMDKKTISGTVTDIDGNSYKTIKVGNQWWMAENLKVTRYRNGDVIPNVTDNTQWTNLSSGARCSYNNENGNVETYGLLYNWYAVDDSRNIAPSGWHVPTDEEWKELEMYLGMSQSDADVTGWRGTDEGGKMKETGTTHWISPNTGATNESGFSALPGGYRDYRYGSYYVIGSYGYWWSSAESGSGAWYRRLYYGGSDVGRYYAYKRLGFSLRLARD